MGDDRGRALKPAFKSSPVPPKKPPKPEPGLDFSGFLAVAEMAPGSHPGLFCHMAKTLSDVTKTLSGLKKIASVPAKTFFPRKKSICHAAGGFFRMEKSAVSLANSSGRVADDFYRMTKTFFGMKKGFCGVAGRFLERGEKCVPRGSEGGCAEAG